MTQISDPFGAGLARFGAMSRENATAALRACCGSSRWATAVEARRPFATSVTLFEAAETIWLALGKDDWLEAFSHHPRIGARDLSGRHAATAEQSTREQAGMAMATEVQRREFAELNGAYEEKFGHVFLISATGKTPEQMLSRLRARLGNEAEQELRNAAQEQTMITRLRLERMLSA
jgi:OHCU decarboxylase